MPGHDAARLTTESTENAVITVPSWPGEDPAIHVFRKGVDARNKSGHDKKEIFHHGDAKDTERKKAFLRALRALRGEKQFPLTLPSPPKGGEGMGGGETPRGG